MTTLRTFFPILTALLFLSSCSKREVRVEILKDGAPLQNATVALDILDMVTLSGARHEAITDSSGVALFPSGDLDGDTAYDIVLLREDGSELRIGASGSGKLSSVGLWQESGFKIKISH